MIHKQAFKIGRATLHCTNECSSLTFCRIYQVLLQNFLKKVGPHFFMYVLLSKYNDIVKFTATIATTVKDEYSLRITACTGWYGKGSARHTASI